MSGTAGDIITVVLMLPMVGYSFWLIWRTLGGLRGLRTPRIVGPLLVALLGVVLALGASAMMRERVPGVPWVPNPPWMFTTAVVGFVLFAVGFAVALGWPTARHIRLVRVMRRLDDYVQGSQPLPLPEKAAALRDDLATAHRLLADPAHAHAVDPVVIARIAALHHGSPLPQAVPARD